MQKDTIITKAKEDNGAIVNMGVWLAVVSLLVFAFHWTYIFNCFAGPFQLEKKLVERSTIKKFVEADLDLVPVGSKMTGLKIFGSVVAETETARLMVTEFEGKRLLVRVESGYKEGRVKGGVTALSSQLKQQLSGRTDFYPLMLDCQSNYKRDTDLFMLIAIVLFPLSLLIMITGLLRKGNLANHGAIAQFKGQGEPLAMVEQIEAELSTLPHNQDNSVVYYSSNWVVILEPSLKIIPADNLIAYGIEKNKNGGESVVLWMRRRVTSVVLITDRETTATIINRLKSAFPNRYASDAKSFEKRWNVKRKEVEEEFDASL